jgi:hypothetical protein
VFWAVQKSKGHSQWLVSKKFLICVHYLVATVTYQLLLEHLYVTKKKFQKWCRFNLDNI